MLELLAEEMIFGLPEDVPDHFMRILDGMRRRQYSSKNLAACCFNREEDKYLGLPLEGLYEVFPILFNGILKRNRLRATNFLNNVSLLKESGVSYTVVTDFDEALKDVITFKPQVCIAFKLFEQNKMFRNMPIEEKRARIFEKSFIEKTVCDIIEPVLSVLDSKLVVYGPNENVKIKGYDALRYVLENKIFDALNKKYGKYSKLELRKDKHIINAVSLLKKYCLD